jgi:hypothetical protein
MENGQIWESLSAYLDEELAEPDKEELERRLLEDHRTQAELNALKQTVSSLSSLDPVAPPAQFRRQLMERVKREQTARRQGVLQWLKGIRWRIWGPAIGAALVLMLAAGNGLLWMNGIKSASNDSGGLSAAIESAQAMPGMDSSMDSIMASEAADDSARAAAVDLEPESVQRQLIRHADVALIVDDFSQSGERLRTQISETGGYIANEESHQWDGIWTGQFQIRLPANRLDPFLEALESMGDIESRRLYSEDVTMEYVDVQSRIQMMRVKEARLLELISQSGNLADLLNVENELANTRGNLESLEGRMRYLSNQVAYSTVQLQVEQKIEPTGAFEETGLLSAPGRFKAAFIASINRLLILLGDLIVWFGRVLPYLAVAAALLWILWQIVKRTRKRRMKENG